MALKFLTPPKKNLDFKPGVEIMVLLDFLVRELDIVFLHLTVDYNFEN